MTNRLIRPGNSYLIPGRPYRAPQAAYDTTETVKSITTRPVVNPNDGRILATATSIASQYSLSPGWVWRQFTISQPDGTTIQNWYPFWGGSSSVTPPAYITNPATITTTTQVSVITHHPAVTEDPGVPDTYVNVPPLGWNAFAHSISTIMSGEGQWTMDKAVTGVVVGLSVSPNNTAGYTHIPHGLLFSGNRVINARTGSQYDTWVPTDVFKVRNASGTITYYKNGSSIGSEASLLPPQPVYLASVLYGNTDSVDVPSLVETYDAVGAMTIPRMTMLGVDYAGYGQGALRMPAMTMSGAFNDVMTLPALRMFGTDVEGASGAMVIPPMTMAAFVDFIPVDHLTTGELVMPRMGMTAISMTGQVGYGEMSITPMSLLGSDYAYATGSLTLPEMWMAAHPEDEQEGYMMEAAISSIGTHGSIEALVFMLDGVAVGYTMTSSVMLDALMQSIANVHDTWTTSQIMEALMLSIIRTGLVLGGTGAGVVSSDSDTWAVNVDNNGSTSYTNFGFNSYGRQHGKYYGANENGIYLLEGDTDAGAAIRASASFGVQRFGTTEKKTVEQCYLGMSAQGNLFIKIIAEGAAYIYKTRDFSEEIQQQRVTFGKGLRTNYVTLEIYNENGDDFELDTVKFIVSDMKRKI